MLAGVVEQLGGKRAAADAGAVGFGDAVYLIYMARRDAEAGAGAGGNGAGRGNVGIGAEINIEQGALGAFGEDALALGQQGVE